MSTKALPKTVFLAELDALLDTRASIIFDKLGEESTIELFKNGYFNRTVDDFKGLGFTEFRKLYANRDKSVLVNALSTKIMNLVVQFAWAVVRNITATPFHMEPKILINIYPYKLTDTEIANIHAMIRARIKDICEVEIIDFSYKDLGPKFISTNNISYFALYDYVDWINTHIETEDFLEYKNPESALVIPQIIFSKPDKSVNPYVNNTFEILQDVLGPSISLNYMPVSDFSVSMPKM